MSPLSLKDIESIQTIVHDEVQKGVEPVSEKINNLHNSVDKYIKRTETWHLEFKVLEAQFKKVQQVLIEKSIATEKELSLMSEDK